MTLPNFIVLEIVEDQLAQILEIVADHPLTLVAKVLIFINGT
jgi:hypothetical protein